MGFLRILGVERKERKVKEKGVAISKQGTTPFIKKVYWSAVFF